MSEEMSKNSDVQNVMVEIRAGTGGNEAGLFAADLFRMYSRYADSAGWKKIVLDSKSTPIGGTKEIIFELQGKEVFKKMRYEGGVHRVQRIPETEKRGRVHTSTATVAILAKPKKEEIKINLEDLKIDTLRASGPGGQYTNKRETAVRILHKPTGLTVTCQSEKSQAQNKESALKVLSARLFQKKQGEKEKETAGERKSQIKWAKRAEKIRTYNFPQNRLTDHRIKKSWHNLEKIIEGDLEPVIKTILKKAQQEN